MNKKKKKHAYLKWLIPVCIILLVFSVTLVIDLAVNAKADEIEISEAQKLIDETFSSLPNSISLTSKDVVANTKITVNDMDYGISKNVILDCSYETIDIGNPVKSSIKEIMTEVYEFYAENEKAGTRINATKIMLFIGDRINSLLETSEKLSGNVEIQLFQTQNGYSVYLDDDTVNTVLGGILDAKKCIEDTDTVEYEGETVSIKNQNTLRNGCVDCIKLINYNSSKPESASFYARSLKKFTDSFVLNFGEGKWKYLTNGLLTTLEITLLALGIGILIGFVAAIIRCTHDKTGALGFLNGIFKIYISIMRGTPVMIQLLIIYFVILLPVGVQKFPAAVICFGINSGSYVAEIMRGGLMAIDAGQEEAGRSLGFNYVQTMIHIIIPQAFKAVLPALANEFIALLKETSVAFYIGVADLTQGGLKIRAITYSNFMPLVAIAVIYFVLVYILTQLVSLLEKRLRKSER